MAGRTLTCSLIATSTDVNGTPGGSSLQLDPPLTVSLAETRKGDVLALASVSSPVSLPMPSSGVATWLFVKVLDTPTAGNAPRALITSADGTAQVIPFAAVLAIGSPIGGPPMTAISLKGVCSVEYLVGG